MTRAEFRVLLTGSRGWTDRDAIRTALLNIQTSYGDKAFVLIHGGAHGADKLGKIEALRLGWTHEEYEPDWGDKGKRRWGGLERNGYMIKHCNLHAAVAFCLNQSPGTMHCIRLMKKEQQKKSYV